MKAYTMVGGNGRQTVRGNGRGKFWLGNGGITMSRMPENAYTEKRRNELAKMATEQTGTACRWIYDGVIETVNCA